MKFRLNLLIGLSTLALGLPQAAGRIIKIDWEKPQSIANQEYELKKGKAHYVVDPKSELNSVIVDLALAPRDENGLVHFTGDITIQYPKDPSRFKGLSWVHIPNRGGIGKLTKNQMERGLAMLNVGWEFDLPEDASKLHLKVPQVTHPDGSVIAERVTETFVVDRPTKVRKLSDLWVYEIEESRKDERRLIIRERSAFAEGTELPLNQWTLAKGEIQSEVEFQPGKTYEISYIAKNPYVGGLGYAAVRDAVMWLKHGKTVPVKVNHAVAFGSSQCGRFLRDFLYLGFNQMENGRATFDGVISHVAGAGRLVLNQRWSKPRSLAAYDTASFPFSDRAQLDPVTGVYEGVLENKRAKHLPKLFYINTGSEYWGAGRVGGLIHTTVDGTGDELFFNQVRSYYYSGTQHGAAAFPPPKLAEDGLYLNPVRADDITETLRIAMEEWVVNKVLPPSSVHPRLSDGTLVKASDVKFPTIPGVDSPTKVAAGPRIVNPQLHPQDGAGTPMPLMVPQVDEDGNDLGGIRMPELEVPLATATGWIFRSVSMGEPQEFALLRGSWVPFALTKADRLKTGDPRPSIEERYKDKQDYLTKIKSSTKTLIQKGFLLERHIEAVMQRAEEQWNWLHHQGN